MLLARECQHEQVEPASVPPTELPGRERIIARLWTIVSDIEKTLFKNRIRDEAQEAEAALKAGDAKKASKAIDSLAGSLSEGHDPGANTNLERLRSGLRLLGDKSQNAKQLIVCRKLLDKADKLAFPQERKKAIKTYQECLFWLSRNNISNKTGLVADAQQKLSEAETRSQSPTK
jgi:hypothetical protein